MHQSHRHVCTHTSNPQTTRQAGCPVTSKLYDPSGTWSSQNESCFYMSCCV